AHAVCCFANEPDFKGPVPRRFPSDQTNEPSLNASNSELMNKTQSRSDFCQAAHCSCSCSCIVMYRVNDLSIDSLVGEKCSDSVRAWMSSDSMKLQSLT